MRKKESRGKGGHRQCLHPNSIATAKVQFLCSMKVRPNNPQFYYGTTAKKLFLTDSYGAVWRKNV